MVPYDNNLILTELLNPDDKRFINLYHEKIWNILSPILIERNEAITIEWLKKRTTPIA